jgi:phage nucleotide-binding protein
MTQNFEKVPDKINRGVAIVIYSDPGIGKTTLATTLPEGETLIINTEAGLGPLLGTKHIVFNLQAVIKNYEIEEAVDELYKFLRTQKHDFKYIVLDNISELEQQLILNITMRRGKETPELREYGDVAFKMKEWMRLFRDLVHQGITIVFNAWEFPIEIKNIDGQVITKTFPMIGKKIAPQVCGIVDVVGHLEVHEKSGKRWVRFGPSDQYVTKSQFKGLDSGEPADLPMILNKLYSYDYDTRTEEQKKEDELKVIQEASAGAVKIAVKELKKER